MPLHVAPGPDVIFVLRVAVVLIQRGGRQHAWIIANWPHIVEHQQIQHALYDDPEPVIEEHDLDLGLDF